MSIKMRGVVVHQQIHVRVNKYYTLQASSVSVDEGSSVTITLQTVGVAPGTVLPYTITGISSADISGAGLTGAFTVQGTESLASDEITFLVSADLLTEGTEAAVLTLDNNLGSINFQINDTSQTQVPLASSIFKAQARSTSTTISATGAVGDTIYAIALPNWGSNTTYNNATPETRVPVGYTLDYVARDNGAYKYPLFIWKKTATSVTESVTFPSFVSAGGDCSLATVRVPAGITCKPYNWSLAPLTYSGWNSEQIPTIVGTNFTWPALTLDRQSIVIDLAVDLGSFGLVSGNTLPLLARTTGNSAGVYWGATLPAGSVAARPGTRSSTVYDVCYTTLVFN